MPKCVYCGVDYEFPKGLTLVGKDGSINYLCSSKCGKNKKMKRRKVRWILKKKKDKKEVLEPVKEEIKEIPKPKVKEEKQETPEPKVKEEKQPEKPISKSA